MQIKTSGSLRRTALTTLGLCLLAMTMATTALAAPGHVLTGSVTDAVFGGLAVNQTSGAVYAADAGGISEIGSGTATPFVAGTSFGGLAVDSASGTLYAIDNSTFPATVNRYDSAGASLGPLDTTGLTYFNPTAIAVDPSTGDVFVANADPTFSLPRVIDVFDDTGTFQTELTGDPTPFGASVNGLAIDGSSNLYVLDGGNVNRYATDGTFEAALSADSNASAVAADPATDDVYVTTFQPLVINYDTAGTVLFRFGIGQLQGASGVAVTSSSNRVWVADATAGAVPFFDPVLAPDVTTGPATATANSADLTGTVDPLGEATSYHFDWGTDTFYGNSTDPVDAGSGTGDVPAAASLTGLLPNQEYNYRLVAVGLATNFGDNQTFQTDPIPATVSTGASEQVTRKSARINGIVNPQNSHTDYYFEYGLTTAYGAEAGKGAFDPPDVSDHAVSADLVDLAGGVTYHYRVVADNGTGGQQVGGDQTFTTLDPLATAVVDAPTDVTQTSATVRGTVDNHGFPATYYFTVKATESPYVGSSTQISLPPADGPQAVSASFSNLPIGSGFEVRIVTVTGGGTLVSDPLGFRTQDSGFVPLTPPIVDVNPYGCVAPHLNAYTAKAKPGRAITLTGSDLGVGGVVSFGAALADADSWSADAIRVVVPEGARGSASVKVDCSRESNTIKVSIAKAAKKKAKAKTCKRGYVKKKVKGKARCVKKPAKRKAGRKDR